MPNSFFFQNLVSVSNDSVVRGDVAWVDNLMLKREKVPDGHDGTVCHSLAIHNGGVHLHRSFGVGEPAQSHEILVLRIQLDCINACMSVSVDQ